MTLAASLAVSLVGHGAARRFDQATKDPVGTQLRKLIEIMERNRYTEYGMEHGFSSVKSLEDFGKSVPVSTYQDIQERVDRMTRGEKNVLTAEDPIMFARTSGTTGKPKFIPVTPTCLRRDHADQMRTWLFHAQKEHPQVFKGKILSLVSPAVEGKTDGGIPYGSTSGHIYQNLPSFLRRTYALPYEVFEIEDYSAKYYAVMRVGLGCDVTLLCTANPSSIVKMCEVANERAEELIKDLADGTLRQDLEMPAKTRELLESGLKPDRERARMLEQARQRRGGKLLPADYWPHLALVGCWKGGTVGSYVERFPEWFDPDHRQPVPVRDWGYLSSEARGSIPLTDEGSGGVLTVATNVYEFVKVQELEEAPEDWKSWKFLGVDQLETSGEYYVFITTTGGLYRYDINDVIAVEGEYHETPVIVFRRKGRGMTNITGEKVSVNHVMEAVESAAAEHQLKVDHFRAEADQSGACYIFKIECADGIPEARRKPLLQSLDEKLSSLNDEYRAKRKSMRLNPPLLHVMKAGWYDQEKKQQAADGKRVFQAKTVLLAPRNEEEEGKGDDPKEEMVSAVVALKS